MKRDTIPRIMIGLNAGFKRRKQKPREHRLHDVRRSLIIKGFAEKMQKIGNCKQNFFRLKKSYIIVEKVCRKINVNVNNFKLYAF